MQLMKFACSPRTRKQAARRESKFKPAFAFGFAEHTSLFFSLTNMFLLCVMMVLTRTLAPQEARRRSGHGRRRHGQSAFFPRWLADLTPPEVSGPREEQRGTCKRQRLKRGAPGRIGPLRLQLLQSNPPKNNKNTQQNNKHDNIYHKKDFS